MQLPTDAERSSATEYQAAASAGVRHTLFRPTRREELLGALFGLLQRYTQQETISLDVFIRDGAAEWQIALDLEVAGDGPVSSVIDSTRLALMVAVPPMRDMGRPSNIAATFIQAPRRTGSSIEPEMADLPTGAGYDAHFVLMPTPDGVVLSVVYNARLLRPSTVGRLVESYGVLLAATLSDRTTAVHRLPLLSPRTIDALSAELDGETAIYPALPIHRLFGILAKRQPEALAAACQGRRLTYGDLEARSNRLAHHLIACGVGPDVPVAVCVTPSLEVLVAMLAIWKARGVYLPLDPTHPETLIGQMLDEARPRLVLTSAALSGLTGRYPQFCFDRDSHLLRKQPRTAPRTEPCLADPAYLLYTSGTTGKAKGVVGTQANLVQYIHSAGQRYGFTARDIFVSVARYTFSISLFELVSPLCCGGSLRILERDEILCPERLCRTLKEVTVLHAGPSLLGSLFRYLRATPSVPRAFPKMRHASSGGDMVTPAVMEEMARVFPKAELFVIYGCSEVSCMGTSYAVDREATASRTLVGKPFPNVTLRVFDADRNLVPFGVVGEICFAGAGVAEGYLDRPELTAEKFAWIDGRRFYQTGDIGRLHADGNLEILGRRDFQVKLRGIRIELAGIEKVVQALGLAAQCAVVAIRQGEGDVRLVAFVVKPRNDKIATFRRALARELPDYMLPHRVVVLEAMPLTANGKLDRNRLKEMPWQTRLDGNGTVGPVNDRERTVAEIFARVLGLREVGVEDSFFDLGGDSLLGAIALTEIERAIGVAIPPSVLFENGTVRALADHRPDGDPDMPKPILLNGKCSGPPLFLLSGVHIYRELARQLDGRCAAYGVFAPHELLAFDPASEIQSVETLAQDYIRIIRRQQPTGPYRLLGYSFSGIVAYEVARQLTAAGETIELLTLVDSHLPEWSAGWKCRLAMIGRLRSAPLRSVAAFFRRRLREKFAPDLRNEALVYHDDQELGRWEVQRGVANGNTVARYRSRIRSFPGIGKVVLIASGTRLREEPLHSPSCGWSPYVPDLEVHTIDADHFQMMRDEPYVSRTAEIIVRNLSSKASSEEERL